MRLRLLVEIDADPETVAAVAVMQEDQRHVSVDPRDGGPSFEGRLVGAVPADDPVTA